MLHCPADLSREVRRVRHADGVLEVVAEDQAMPVGLVVRVRVERDAEPLGDVRIPSALAPGVLIVLGPGKSGGRDDGSPVRRVTGGAPCGALAGIDPDAGLVSRTHRCGAGRDLLPGIHFALGGKCDDVAGARQVRTGRALVAVVVPSARRCCLRREC